MSMEMPTCQLGWPVTNPWRNGWRTNALALAAACRKESETRLAMLGVSWGRDADKGEAWWKLFGKLQPPLDRLEARLLAQGVQERIGFQVFKARVPQAQRRLEPFERLRPIAPLRIDRGVLVGRPFAHRCLQFRQLGFCIRVPAELVIDHREAPLTLPGVRLRLA